MSGSDDLAPLIRTDEEPFGYHQGIVEAWDSATGTNVINVGGTPLSNLDVLATSDSVFLAPGDPVLILKFRSNLCIMGRIAPAGSGALGIRAISNAATSFVTTVGSYGDLDSGPGPTLSNVYIGSSRRCLVILTTAIYAATDNDGAAHFEVSGASAISPPTGPSAFSEGAFIGTFSGGAAAEGCVTKTFLLTSTEGLNSGFNSFTMKYMARNVGVDDTFFSDRVITVLPL